MSREVRVKDAEEAHEHASVAVEQLGLAIEKIDLLWEYYDFKGDEHSQNMWDWSRSAKVGAERAKECLEVIRKYAVKKESEK